MSFLESSETALSPSIPTTSLACLTVLKLIWIWFWPFLEKKICFYENSRAPSSAFSPGKNALWRYSARDSIFDFTPMLVVIVLEAFDHLFSSFFNHSKVPTIKETVFPQIHLHFNCNMIIYTNHITTTDLQSVYLKTKELTDSWFFFQVKTGLHEVLSEPPLMLLVNPMKGFQISKPSGLTRIAPLRFFWVFSLFLIVVLIVFGVFDISA